MLLIILKLNKKQYFPKNYILSDLFALFLLCYIIEFNVMLTVYALYCDFLLSYKNFKAVFYFHAKNLIINSQNYIHTSRKY